MNNLSNNFSGVTGEGVRALGLEDVSPGCAFGHDDCYSLSSVIEKGMSVVDIGCGQGFNRPIIEQLGAEWTGVEPFRAEPGIIQASAEKLPFPDGYFDIAIMDAVLEHIPDVSKAFAEVARILKPGGKFVGYVAFMECFHEISYNHLSFKALEEYSTRNGMQLESLGGGSRFGLDYHVARLLEPHVRFNSFFTKKILRPTIARFVRGVIFVSAFRRYLGNRRHRGLDKSTAWTEAKKWQSVERLKFSNGFSYVITKPNSQNYSKASIRDIDK